MPSKWKDGKKKKKATYGVVGRSRTWYRKRYQPAFKMPYRNLSCPYPDTMRTYLKYAGTATLTCSALSPTGYYLVRANSCYDPVVAVGGHQPRGFDEMMNAYKVGCVLSSKITAWYAPQTNSPPMICSITLVDSDSYTPTTTYSPIEQQHVSEDKNIIAGLAGNSSTAKISYTYNPVVFNGVKNVVDMDEYEFSSSADCVNQTNFVLCASVIPITDAGAYVFYEITYDIQLKSRKVLPAS